MDGSPGSAISAAVALAALSSVGALGLSLAAPSPIDGVISGRVVLMPGAVRFVGEPPVAEPIDMSADRYCREQHSSPVMDQAVNVGATGGLSQVLVHVRNAPAGTEPSSDDVVLDQLACLYAPAVVAIRIGQTLIIRNSDATLHNVRVSSEVNGRFNIGQPLAGIESKRQLEQPEIGIRVRCDIHGWMQASIHVLDHAFFDLSQEDGSFTLPALPAGEYEIEAWHPTLGSSTQTVTVEAGSSPDIVFEFPAP